MPGFVQVPGQGGVGVVKIGTADPPTTVVSCQVTVCVAEPNNRYVAVPQTAGCDPRQEYAGSEFGLQLDWLQDWGETDSLSQFLQTNKGSTVFVLHQPLGVGETNFTYEVTAVPGRQGGTMGEIATSSVVLPIIDITITAGV